MLCLLRYLVSQRWNCWTPWPAYNSSSVLNDKMSQIKNFPMVADCIRQQTICTVEFGDWIHTWTSCLCFSGEAGLYAADKTCSFWPLLRCPAKTRPKARKTSWWGSLGEGSPAWRGSNDTGTANILETCTIVGLLSAVEQDCIAASTTLKPCKIPLRVTLCHLLNFRAHKDCKQCRF